MKYIESANYAISFFCSWFVAQKKDNGQKKSLFEQLDEYRFDKPEEEEDKVCVALFRIKATLNNVF